MPAAPKQPVASAGTSASTHAAPKKRSRDGCLVCRKRKHKCDSERHATADGTYSCARCLKTGKTCLWPVAQPLEARFAPYPATTPASGPVVSSNVVDSSSSHSRATSVAPAQQSSTGFNTAPSSASRQTPAPVLSPVEASWTGDTPPTAEWLRHLLPRNVPGSSPSYLQTFGPPPPPAPTPAPTSNAPPPAASPMPFFWPSPQLAAGGTTLETNPALDLGSWAGSPWAQNGKMPIARGAEQVLPQSTDSGGEGTLPFELMEIIGSQVNADPSRTFPMTQDDWALATVPTPRSLEPTPTLVQLWPDPEERNLMTHFLKMVPTVCAPQPRLTISLQNGAERPLDSVGESVQAFFPFLDIPAFLSTPRRTSTASEALSLACMSVGAVHLQYLHQQSAVAAQARPGGEALALVSLAAHDKYGRLASSLSDSSLALGQTSLLLSQLSARPADDAAGPTSKTAMGRREDLSHLLAACSASVLSRCLAGTAGHGPMLDLANEVVSALGGPTAMLEAEAAGRSLLFPEATRRTSTRKRVRIVRSLLEDLAAWDAIVGLTADAKSFGCRTEGVAADKKLSDWLFRYAPPPRPIGGPGGDPPEGDEDWDTLAYTTCIARPIFDLLCRVNQLHSAHLDDLLARGPDSTDMTPSPAIQRRAEDLLLEIRLRSRDIFRSHPDLSFERAGADKTEVSTLVFSCSEWTVALEIFVLFELLGEAKSSLKIQTLAFHVVNLFDERMRRGQNEYGSDWPLVIAGTMLQGEQERAAVRRIVLSSNFPFAFDMNRKFCELLDEVWAAHDSGDRRASWRSSKTANSGLLLF